jgi:hypothetical protein
MSEDKRKGLSELCAAVSNERHYFDAEVVRNTSRCPILLICSICGKVVDLEISKTDEHGNAVHGQCYAAMSWLSGE